MENEDMSGAMKSLDALLEAERAALLTGNLEALGEMVDQKEGLIGKLNDAMPDGSQSIADLRVKVERNQSLLNGAMDGIRSVAERIAALRKVRSSLDTYDADGRKCSVSIDRGGDIERRA
ncbi:flagellar biosynthesis protein FlgN [Sulfitobacter sp. SK012]|uniref:flagellar biosynthesis protein FlgN n=1 Tax=Sulfitobacter sp. SK012 TaxID=1389005 RepID=UPI000E0BEA64|nr:flagellar biosynthesis protein FlgN [Sulfitobacter sp. SK012]AXI48608.1 flagellar biosynthesis protein FlgN [Sulfitobacter sp. SK012]